MTEVVELPSDRPSAELLLKEAIVAYKAGNKTKARYWGIHLTQVTPSALVEDYPRDLLEFEARFASEGACRDYLSALRWPEGFRWRA